MATGRRNKKIPLMPVVGGAITGWLALTKIVRVAGDSAYPTPGDALRDLAMATVGLSKSPETGKLVFSWDTLSKGLLPDFIPLGVGVAGHEIAKKTGVNRALASVPWFSL